MNPSVAHTSHRTVYLIFGVAFLLLTGIALLTFHSAEESREADAKADQLISELTAAGARAPSQEQIARVLGDDGGAVCANAGEALSRGVLYSQITNGAAGPGQRPVIADSKVVQGQLLIMKVYCPDKVAEFQQVVDDLEFDDVAAR
ncbi:hypothetical protein ACFQFC_02290 [Amorphoplanes digitatis]|uniref:Tfp pilus assembly protein FimT n=1 Tax=Actinoplanes digitatis TaxID=1868 RepID=A0A7W7HY97_9ACTN|nr:hypothetical protein [Actinoplanes digitatis]MBB4763007.1 Tfp pilus assembly protein FimT [Actinoplanes digitatis]BFE71983.1 hypothetical protein GCM10020092_052840 [Actinoplanes digitatis]GID95792.1 hypothetical protein Adi01nite_52040 [Actinoplanes digitatis]